MVQRYTGEDCMIWPDGEWVSYADYQSLQAALREALDEWGGWAELFGDGPAQTHDGERIAELRKQFLDI